MLSFLVENTAPTYLILGLVALAVGVGLWTTRQRKYFIGLVILAALMVLVALLDYFIVSDSEQIVANLDGMAKSVARRDFDYIFERVSKDFSRDFLDKAAFRQYAEDRVKTYEVSEMVVWDVKPTKVSRKDREADVEFHAKLKGNWGGAEYFLCRVKFVLDADGKWRLQGFEVSNPHVETNTPLPLPQ